MIFIFIMYLINISSKQLFRLPLLKTNVPDMNFQNRIHGSGSGYNKNVTGSTTLQQLNEASSKYCFFKY